MRTCAGNEDGKEKESGGKVANVRTEGVPRVGRNVPGGRRVPRGRSVPEEGRKVPEGRRVPEEGRIVPGGWRVGELS